MPLSEPTPPDSIKKAGQMTILKIEIEIVNYFIDALSILNPVTWPARELY
jgi:hypothetical protein